MTQQPTLEVGHEELCATPSGEMPSRGSQTWGSGDPYHMIKMDPTQGSR